LTVAQVLEASTAFLAGKGVPTPRVDAEHLLAAALGVSRLDLYLQYDRALNEAELAAARELVRRRGTREPLAYVLGEWSFRRLTLTTDRRALIPRPETETVVERCLARLSGLEAPRVLDVGVGSGAIALAIVDEHLGATVTALDDSTDALDGRVTLEHGDFGGELPAGPYDLVVSNPPYVEPEEIGLLEPEVRDWEPRVALVGRGATEAVAAAAREVLAPGAWLVLEVADWKAGAVSELLTSLGFADVVRSPDLAGRERVVEGRWAP
jgi:release factor glutamine methyltransferase